MKRTGLKSHCAVNFALENFGDPWSLLIVRDIAFDGKHSFREFLASDERISTNILSNRLERLEAQQILVRTPSATDGRVMDYALTAKGVDLIPILLALSAWSFQYDPETEATQEFAEFYAANPVRVAQILKNVVLQGRSAFAGQNPGLNDLRQHFQGRQA